MQLSEFTGSPKRAIRSLAFDVLTGAVSTAPALRIKAWLQANLNWQPTGPTSEPGNVGGGGPYADLLAADIAGELLFSTDAIGTTNPTPINHQVTPYSSAVKLVCRLPWDTRDGLAIALRWYGPNVQAGDLDSVMAAVTLT
jgi:hypothetical protein